MPNAIIATQVTYLKVLYEDIVVKLSHWPEIFEKLDLERWLAKACAKIQSWAPIRKVTVTSRMCSRSGFSEKWLHLYLNGICTHYFIFSRFSIKIKTWWATTQVYESPLRSVVKEKLWVVVPLNKEYAWEFRMIIYFK